MVATQVRPDTNVSLLTGELNLSYTLKQLKQQGILFHGEQPDNSSGLLVELVTEQGTAYWVGLQNFYVITRYNHSKHYATAVYQLAKEIADNYYASSHSN
jgi:membrane-bound lytic murein transglycosylase B